MVLGDARHALSEFLRSKPRTTVPSWTGWCSLNLLHG